MTRGATAFIALFTILLFYTWSSKIVENNRNKNIDKVGKLKEEKRQNMNPRFGAFFVSFYSFIWLGIVCKTCV